MTDRAYLFVSSLRLAGLRLTPQRMAICRMLANDSTHPSAAQLFERLQADFPTLSFATVYSTLNTLIELGLVHDLGTAGDGQGHYDPNTSPHANLVCTVCHQIIDLEDSALETVSQHVEQRSGYHIQGARIVYYGVCPSCGQKAAGVPE